MGTEGTSSVKKTLITCSGDVQILKKKSHNVMNHRECMESFERREVIADCCLNMHLLK